MEISDTERIILINQYNILIKNIENKFDPTTDQLDQISSYERCIRILTEGIVSEYYRLEPSSFYPQNISDEVFGETEEILEMFHHIELEVSGLEDEIREANNLDTLYFIGFDFHKQAHYLRAAKYIVDFSEHLSCFKSRVTNSNTFSTNDIYIEMLNEYKSYLGDEPVFLPLYRLIKLYNIYKPLSHR